ncbi:MAG: SMC-Scp complex subunit ScpB [Acidimicrobiales bacterium]
MSENRIEPPSAEMLTEARRAVEAMLLVANDPTPEQLLAQLVELPSDLVGAMCRELAAEYETQGRGFQLVEIAGGWRYQTHPDVHPYVERYALEGIPNRLSSAALETLAIVAYKQPISRGQISAIRGVNVDAVLRTLVQRGYVVEDGKDDGPGQATLFATTDVFLETLGLMSTDDLPPLGDFVPSAQVLEALEQTLKITDEPIVLDDEPAAETPEEPAEATESLETESLDAESLEAPESAEQPDSVEQVESVGAGSNGHARADDEAENV